MPEPIRVLHLITSLHSGGAEMMLRKLVQGMDRSRFVCVVVSMTPGGMHAEALRQAGIAVVSLDLERGLPTPGAVARLARLCWRFRPQVIQGWMYHADALAACVRAVCPAARRAGWLWNVRCSDMDFSRYNPLTRLLVQGLARISSRPHAVLVNSWSGLQHHVALGYQPRRWAVVPNGFDLDGYRPDESAGAWLRELLGCASDAPLVTLVARVDAMKDHATFLEAVAHARRRLPALGAVLVGRGAVADHPDLAPLIARHGLAGAVHGLGERRDVARILAGSTCAVLSSAFGEGFPNVVGEAMACGTPCAVTNVGDAARIVGDTGAVVPPRDSMALAEAMVRLVAAPDLEERGRQARQRVADRFSLPAIIRRYESIYAAVARTAA